MLGVTMYTDLFAGTLSGVLEKLDYLQEQGVTYLHLMPLLKMPHPDNDGGYAVEDFNLVDPGLGSNEDLERLIQMYGEMNLKNPAVIIDTNHSNSNKQYEQQIRIAKEIMHNRKIEPNIRNIVKGLMIESYIEPGCQKVGEHVYGKSITDPCLGWKESEALIYHIAEMNQ